MEKEIIARISNWLSGKRDYPYGLELSPTLKCNISCSFCWRRAKDAKPVSAEIPPERYLEIIRQAGSLGVREIKIIGGGESTTRKDIIPMMLEVKKRGMRGYICTNGTMFTEDGIRSLVAHSWDHVKISLHGAAAGTHDAITNRKGSFDSIIRNVRLFNEFKKKQKSSSPLLEFGVVLTNSNFRQVPQIIRLAGSLGANMVFIEPVTVYSDEGRALKLSGSDDREFSGIARESEKVAEGLGITTNLKDFINTGLTQKTNAMETVLAKGRRGKGRPGISCYEPFYRMGIRADGIVCPCGFFDEGSAESISGKSLEEIWFGEYFTQKRKEMMEGNLSPYCSRCCTTLVSNNLRIQEELEKNGSG